MEEIKECVADVNQEQPNDTNDDGLSSNEKDIFTALHTKSQINDLVNLCKDIKNAQTQYDAMCGNIDDSDDVTAFIDKQIESLSVDDIKSMNGADLIKLCTMENGKLSIGGLFSDDDIDGIREYIVFRKETNNSISELNGEISKLEKYYDEYNAEIKDAVSSCGDMTGHIKETINKRIENATTEEAKQRYYDMLKMLDYGLNLENVIEYYSNPYRARTAIVNVKAPKAGKQVIKHYEHVITQVSCKTDFRRFGGIEPNRLPEPYNTKPVDSFMYSIVNYIASWWKNEDNTLNGLFLAQFSINLKNLVYNKFSNDEDKQTFINAICKVLDLVA